MKHIASPSAAIRQTAFANASAVTGLTPAVINGRVFLPVNSAEDGEETNYVYEAELVGFPKASGAWAAGDPIYWHATNGNFTTTAASAVLCGFALQPADSGDTTTPLMLFSSFANLPSST